MNVSRSLACAPRILRLFVPVLSAAWLLAGSAAPAFAATLGPSLSAKLNGLAGSTSVGTVIVAFNTTNGLNAGHLSILTPGGHHPRLPAAEPRHGGSPGEPRPRSTPWPPPLRCARSGRNDRRYYLNDQTRVLTGVDRVRTDAGFTSLHQGLPVSGPGNFAVLVNDSGIDGTHPDLLFPSHLLQNVQGLTDTATLTVSPLICSSRNVPDTDTNVGHGTHCAGIVAGIGAASGGKYAGVAPGANLIGYGSGAVLFILNGLGGFEYALAKQATYNIRVISNSWGGQGAFDPARPRSPSPASWRNDRGIVVVFAAGNSGPGKDTMSAEAKAALGDQRRRGHQRGRARRLLVARSAESPTALPVTPTPRRSPLRAPAANSPPMPLGSPRTWCPPARKPMSSPTGSSPPPTPSSLRPTCRSIPRSAAPRWRLPSSPAPCAAPLRRPDAVAGRGEIDPHPTASQMPGFSEFEVGAGYVNVYAAVDKASSTATALWHLRRSAGPPALQPGDLDEHRGAAAFPYRLQPRRRPPVRGAPTRRRSPSRPASRCSTSSPVTSTTPWRPATATPSGCS